MQHMPPGIRLFIVKIEKLEQGVNIFKVNNKDTRRTKLALSWCLKYWIDFTPCSSALFRDFEHLIVDFVKF